MAKNITIEIQVLTGKADSNVKSLAKETSNLSSTVDRATQSTKTNTSATSAAGKATENQTNTTKRNAKQQDDLGTRLRRLREVYTRIIESKGILNEVDIKRAKQIKKEIDATEESIATNRKAAGDNESSFGRIKKSATSALGPAGLVGLSAAAGVAVVKMTRRAIDVGREYEQQLADLEAITGIAGDRLKFLSDRALEASVTYGEAASNIITANKLVASQLAEKIDFGTDEGARQLADIAEQAIILQKAAGVDLSVAVGTLTTAINQFNLPAEESLRLINSIAAGSKFGAAEVSEQAEAYAQAGAVAAGANLQFEELNAGVQILAANAIKGSQAGTNMRGVLLTLQNSARIAEAGIEGVNLSTDGFSASLEKLKPLLEDSVALEQLFGRQNIAAARILISGAKSVEEMTKKVTGSNVALEQAQIQMNTYNNAAARLSNAIDNQLIAAFQANNGVMVETINLLTDLVSTTGLAFEGMNLYVSEFTRMNEARGLNNLYEGISKVTPPLLALNRGLEMVGLRKGTKGIQEMFDAIDAGTASLKDQIYNIEQDAIAFGNLRKEVEKGSQKYEDYTRIIGKNREELKSSFAQFEEYKNGLVEQKKALEEGTLEYATITEKIKQADTALVTLGAALENTARLVNEPTANVAALRNEFQKFLEMPDPTAEVTQQMAALQLQIEALGGSVEDLVPTQATLSAQYEMLGKELAALLDVGGEVTAESWKRAEAITAEMKAVKGLQDERAREMEYKKWVTEGREIEPTPIKIPVEFVMDDMPDIDFLKFDENPILDASEAMRQLNQELLDYVATSELLGNHSNDNLYAIQATEQAIADLVANGYSAEDAAIKQLVEQHKALSAIEETRATFNQNMMKENIKGLKDLGNAMREEIIRGLKARLAEAIGAQIAKILSTVPFPINLVLAAGAGAAVSALFNQIPKFNTGGEVPGPRSETKDTVHAMLTPQEFVVRKQSALQAPNAMRAINESPTTAQKVERFILAQKGLKYAHSTDKVVGYNKGGFVRPNTGHLVNSVITREITQRESLSTNSTNNNAAIVDAIQKQTEELNRVKSETVLSISLLEDARADYVRMQEAIGR